MSYPGVMRSERITIPARDGFELAADLFRPAAGRESGRVATVNAATAVPRGFYAAFAGHLAERGYSTVTYDYRGIGESRPRSLRGFHARAGDWALLDMAGVVDWVAESLKPTRLLHVGHSFGGQTPGLLPNADRIDAMIAVAAQSGYWRLQGRGQRIPVALHMYVTFPVLARLFGYLPWSRFAAGDDLPRGVALDWASWCRNPRYLLGDRSLPLERFGSFDVPVLAYSIADDAWGTEQAVDAMMQAYPRVERRHVTPAQFGLTRLGHFGFFRRASGSLWRDALDWADVVFDGPG